MLRRNKLKLFVVVLACLLLAASVLTSCSSCKSDYDQGGTNMAKLLLANRRLDSTMLDNDNIFASGVQTFNTLAAKATSYGERVTILLAQDDLVGSFRITGDTAEWSDFVEYNNSYSYFDNVTSIITDTAKRGADFIDEAKQAVTIVDCWLQSGDEKYYLAVDESSETICKVDESGLFICRRHTDEEGRAVYELYIEQKFVCERVKYIPDERYELTQILTFNETQELYFVADHSKGYWETLCSDNGGDPYSETYTVMKDDICYAVDYNVTSQTIDVLGIMSADTKTDICKIYRDDDEGLVLTMQFSGFDGITKVTANVVDINEHGQFTGESGIVIHLANGGTLTPGTERDGVLLDRVYVDALADGYVGSCDIYIGGGTNQERWGKFSSFLAQNGLTCRRDWNTVLDGVGAAEEDAKNLVKYFRWNGCSITDAEGVSAAVDVEKTRVAEMKKIYEDVKDKPVLKKHRNSAGLSNVNFAAITAYDSRDVVLDNGSIRVGTIRLSTDDMTLFEKNSSYVVALAIASDRSEDMVIIDKGAAVVYDGASSLTVTAGGMQFELPNLVEGSYKIVAFLATVDGIRVSECHTIGFDSVMQEEIKTYGKNIRIASTETDGVKNVTLVYRAATDYVVDIQASAPLSYADFLEEVSTRVYVYGTPSDEGLEKLINGDYVAISSGESVTSGTYRMAYTVKNGDSVTNGYVYIRYTAE